MPDEVATPVKGLKVRVCSRWVESVTVTIRALNREYVLYNTPRLYLWVVPFFSDESLGDKITKGSSSLQR